MIRGPKTRAEAEGWRYGRRTAWNPKGVAYDASRCAAAVCQPPHYFDEFQCSRKPGHGPEKLWCKQHAKMAEVLE